MGGVGGVPERVVGKTRYSVFFLKKKKKDIPDYTRLPEILKAAVIPFSMVQYSGGGGGTRLLGLYVASKENDRDSKKKNNEKGPKKNK